MGKGFVGIVQLILIIIILGMLMGLIGSIFGFMFRLAFPIVLIYVGHKKVFRNRTIDSILLAVGVLMLISRLAHFSN